MTMTDHDHEDPSTVMTPEDIGEAMRELERLGLVCRTGAFRNGEPVYVATEHLQVKGTA
jgi:hypothetical protein